LISRVWQCRIAG